MKVISNHLAIVPVVVERDRLVIDCVLLEMLSLEILPKLCERRGQQRERIANQDPVLVCIRRIAVGHRDDAQLQPAPVGVDCLSVRNAPVRNAGPCLVAFRQPMQPDREIELAAVVRIQVAAVESLEHVLEIRPARVHAVERNRVHENPRAIAAVDPRIDAADRHISAGRCQLKLHVLVKRARSRRTIEAAAETREELLDRIVIRIVLVLLGPRKTYSIRHCLILHLPAKLALHRGGLDVVDDVIALHLGLFVGLERIFTKEISNLLVHLRISTELALPRLNHLGLRRARYVNLHLHNQGAEGGAEIVKA